MLLLSRIFSAILFLANFAEGQENVKLEPSVQALKTIGYSIKFLGCEYAIDRLFVLKCPSQDGVWVTDALSLLDQTNCKDNCGSWTNDFAPQLTYKALDLDMSH